MIECPQLLEIDAGRRARAVTFTANDDRLVSGDDDGIQVWRVADGTQVATMRVGPTASVAASKDGRWIAGATWVVDESQVIVWDAKTYKHVFSSGSAIWDVDFSPDSTRLVTAGGEDSSNTATIWDFAARQKVRTLNHDRMVYAARYSREGDRIATTTDKSIQVWDSSKGCLLVNVKVAGNWIPNILWRDNYLFVQIDDGTIKEIDAAAGSTVSEWPLVPRTEYSSITLPPDGQLLAYSGEKTITFWDTTTHSQLALIQHTDDILSINFSSDGQLLAITTEVGIIVKDLTSILFSSVTGPELVIDSAALDAWDRGQLADAEALLSAAIPMSKNRYHVFASRALVRARLGQWDAALVDAKESIGFQRSVMGYIAKCVALVGKGETDRGCGVCDIACLRFPSDHLSLLLIKAVVLFMAGKHVDAISRMDDLITDSTDLIDPVLYVVQAYMHLVCGNLHMEISDYERAIQSFEEARIKICKRTRQPPLIVSLISGWKFDDLVITIQQRLCEALFSAERIKEAGESVLRMVDQQIITTKLVGTWISDFKSRCLEKLEELGNSAVNARQYDEAVSQYGAALSLDNPRPRNLLMKRSNAWAGKGAREDALNDVKEWVRLMLTSGSWNDALIASAGFILERSIIHRVVCEYLETTGRLTDAVACFHAMSSELAHEMDGENANWAYDFSSRCREILEYLGDYTLNTEQYDVAVSQYTTALLLDPPNPQKLLAQRSRAYAEAGKWEDASKDAIKVIELDPSSPSGYERKYAALLGMGHNDDAITAFQIMLSKMSQSSDPDICEQSHRYVWPDQTKKAIRTSIQNAIRDSPSVLINALSGRLCDKLEQAAAFESTPAFTKLITSTTTRINHARIEQVVREFYRYTTFSHTWEGREPLYEKVMKTVVYDLEAFPTHEKLQMFCKVVRDEGFVWAWSDTCCINKGDHFILQEALVRMFKWYEGSAMTIIFLCDVDQLAELGALMMSLWNSRGWTLQEYHASRVVRIYTKDWTPYLGLTIYNHKESPEIISEMEKATGISAQSLMALRPGLNNIREKLCLASTRQTTRVEDVAYSLLGIFSMTLPVTYGEGDKALGRLLSQLLTSSGDTTILAWTGTPNSFNSCLPADIVVFSHPLTLHIPPAIPDDEMKPIASGLNVPLLGLDLATRLYNQLSSLPLPFFNIQRMKLPCLVFQLRRVKAFKDGSELVFRAQAAALGPVEIQTKQNLLRLDSLYLVHPWIDFLLDRHAARNAVETMLEVESFELSQFPDLSGASHADSESVASLSHPSGVLPIDKEIRVCQFLARLRRPFGALLFTPTRQNVEEYRRVATESLITVQVEEMTRATLDQLIQGVRMLDVL